MSEASLEAVVLKAEVLFYWECNRNQLNVQSKQIILHKVILGCEI